MPVSPRSRGLALRGSGLALDELIGEALDGSDRGCQTALSGRELEVADLIASGLTNGEIAQRLMISTRTVESHVDHIKTKLGFARRARIVAWALDRQQRRRHALRFRIRETTDDDERHRSSGWSHATTGARTAAA